jgi:hypothetical protein
MIKRIKGFVQHYAWGGYHFLPSILSIDNIERKIKKEKPSLKNEDS